VGQILPEKEKSKGSAGKKMRTSTAGSRTSAGPVSGRFLQSPLETFTVHQALSAKGCFKEAAGTNPGEKAYPSLRCGGFSLFFYVF
jgi:hypothetical protein